jgi:hypothetical protein
MTLAVTTGDERRYQGRFGCAELKFCLLGPKTRLGHKVSGNQTDRDFSLIVSVSLNYLANNPWLVGAD